MKNLTKFFFLFFCLVGSQTFPGMAQEINAQPPRTFNLFGKIVNPSSLFNGEKADVTFSIERIQQVGDYVEIIPNSSPTQFRMLKSMDTMNIQFAALITGESIPNPFITIYVVKKDQGPVANTRIRLGIGGFLNLLIKSDIISINNVKKDDVFFFNIESTNVSVMSFGEPSIPAVTITPNANAIELDITIVTTTLKTPIAGALVSIGNPTLTSGLTDEQGKISFLINKMRNYFVDVKKPGFTGTFALVPDDGDPTSATLELKQINPPNLLGVQNAHVEFLCCGGKQTNQISWEKSPSDGVDEYLIFKTDSRTNMEPIGTPVLAMDNGNAINSFVFCTPAVCRETIYTIIGINLTNGDETEPVTIKIRPCPQKK